MDARGKRGRVDGVEVCAEAGSGWDDPADARGEEQRQAFRDGMTGRLGGVSGGEGSYLWFEDSDGLMAWKAAEDPVSIDSASSGMSEFLPIEVPFRDSSMQVDIENLSAAYDAVFGAHDAIAYIRREEEKLAAVGEDEEEQRAKLDRRALQQRSAIERFESQAILTQVLAKSIQDNWTHVDELLSQVNSLIENEDWQALDRKVEDVVWIDRVDPVKRTILARLPDEDNEPGASVTLAVEKSVHQNAQTYFEQARTLKDKAKGAKAALERTETQATKEQAKRAKEAAAGRVRLAKRSKRFWFEKHRWGILSDGRMIVGGRDAKGNDTVVRKYLRSTDLYLHADLHGAPSCSLRLRDGPEVDTTPTRFRPEGVASLTNSPEFDDGLAAAQNPPAELTDDSQQIATASSRP